MSNEIKNGDMPAMPIEFNGFGLYAPEAHLGLTKREMFAMTAMQGLLSGDINGGLAIKDIAIQGRQIADALLRELEQTK